MRSDFSIRWKSMTSQIEGEGSQDTGACLQQPAGMRPWSLIAVRIFRVARRPWFPKPPMRADKWDGRGGPSSSTSTRNRSKRFGGLCPAPLPRAFSPRIIVTACTKSRRPQPTSRSISLAAANVRWRGIWNQALGRAVWIDPRRGNAGRGCRFPGKGRPCGGRGGRPMCPGRSSAQAMIRGFS